MTTSPANVLNVPPIQNPTTAMTQNINTMPASINLRQKKQPIRITMKGIMSSPLLVVLEKKYPRNTDPSIAKMSYVDGTEEAYRSKPILV